MSNEIKTEFNHGLEDVVSLDGHDRGESCVLDSSDGTDGQESDHWLKAEAARASRPTGRNASAIADEEYEYTGQTLSMTATPTLADYDRAQGMGQEFGPWFVVDHEGPAGVPLRTEGELISDLDGPVVMIRHVGPGERIVRSVIPWDRIIQVSALEDDLTNWEPEEEEQEPEQMEMELPFRRPKAGE